MLACRSAWRNPATQRPRYSSAPRPRAISRSMKMTKRHAPFGTGRLLVAALLVACGAARIPVSLNWFSVVDPSRSFPPGRCMRYAHGVVRSGQIVRQECMPSPLVSALAVVVGVRMVPSLPERIRSTGDCGIMAQVALAVRRRRRPRAMAQVQRRRSVAPDALAEGESPGERLARARSAADNLEFEQTVALLVPLHDLAGLSLTVGVDAALLETERARNRAAADCGCDRRLCKRGVIFANYNSKIAHEQAHSCSRAAGLPRGGRTSPARACRATAYLDRPRRCR